MFKQESGPETYQRLQKAISAADAGVWEMDFSGNTLMYDLQCAKLFGFDEGSDIMTVDNLITHLERNMTGPEKEDVIGLLRLHELYKKQKVQDIPIKTADGGIRYIRNYGNADRDEMGNITRITGMCVDITKYAEIERDLHDAKEAAEKSDRLKNRFLTNISCEIRTPMNDIIGMSDLLNNENLTGRCREYLNAIRLSSASLLCIINDVLDFSNIEDGKLSIINSDYSLSDMLESLRSMFSFAANDKSIAFELESEDGLPECLFGDGPRLRQALTNILSNAVKFTQKGKIKLRVSKADDMLRFEVKDTGRGIKTEDIPLIFEGFSMFGASNSRNAGGTGLGLPIARNLIKLMNGTFSVESVYGEGSTFTVSVPLVAGDKKNIRATAIAIDPISAPDAKILVVDDNEINLNVAAGLLNIFDISCDTAESGAEAIEKIGANKYDIVFMDHLMPEMDGIEATKLLREKYDDNELIIIALTANAAGGAKEAMLAAGMNDYLSKPIGNMELISVLCRWLPEDKVTKKELKNDAPDVAVSETDAMLARFNDIAPLDVDSGLSRLNGDASAYKDVAENLAKRLLDTVSKLHSSLKTNDLNQLSSDLKDVLDPILNLGAKGVASKLESVKQKADSGDAVFCEDNLPELTAELCELQRQLAEALSYSGAKDGFISTGSRFDLKERLAGVCELLDRLESDDALELLQDIKLRDYGGELNALLQQIYKLTEEYDYEKAISVIKGI